MAILLACVAGRPVEQHPFSIKRDKYPSNKIIGSTQCKQESLFPVVLQLASLLPDFHSSLFRTSSLFKIRLAILCESVPFTLRPTVLHVQRLQFRLYNKRVGREEQVTLFIATFVILCLFSSKWAHFFFAKLKNKALVLLRGFCFHKFHY